jgi:hypothetical protein
MLFHFLLPKIVQLTWPVYMPSLAMKVSVLCLNLYGLRKVTLARGAPIHEFVRNGPNIQFVDWVLTTTGVVDDLLYDTPNVSIALSLYPLALCSSISNFAIVRAADVRSRACGTGRGSCSGGCWP